MREGRFSTSCGDEPGPMTCAEIQKATGKRSRTSTDKLLNKMVADGLIVKGRAPLRLELSINMEDKEYKEDRENKEDMEDNMSPMSPCLPVVR